MRRRGRHDQDLPDLDNEAVISLRYGRGGTRFQFSLSVEGRFIKDFPTMKAALGGAREWMNTNHYWPDLYYVNERGNVSLINSDTGDVLRGWVNRRRRGRRFLRSTSTFPSEKPVVFAVIMRADGRHGIGLIEEGKSGYRALRSPHLIFTSQQEAQAKVDRMNAATGLSPDRIEAILDASRNFGSRNRGRRARRGGRGPQGIYLNDETREEWVNNDEGLYWAWRRSGVGITTWVRNNRALIDSAITGVLTRPPGGRRSVGDLLFRKDVHIPGRVVVDQRSPQQWHVRVFGKTPHGQMVPLTERVVGGAINDPSSANGVAREWADTYQQMGIGRTKRGRRNETPWGETELVDLLMSIRSSLRNEEEWDADLLSSIAEAVQPAVVVRPPRHQADRMVGEIQYLLWPPGREEEQWRSTADLLDAIVQIVDPRGTVFNRRGRPN